MTFVKAKHNESIDSLLKRFKRAVEKSGILSDFKKHEFYEKPSVKRKKKQIAARKRALKREKKLAARRTRSGKNRNFRWNKDRTEKIPLKPRSSGFRNKDTKSSSGNFNKKPREGYKGKKFKNFDKQRNNYKSRQGKGK